MLGFVGLKQPYKHTCIISQGVSTNDFTWKKYCITGTCIGRPVEQIFWRKIVIIFLPINLNICFGCSKEPSHRDVSFEYPQHMFWLGNKKNNFQVCTLIWRPVHGACILEVQGKC